METLTDSYKESIITEIGKLVINKYIFPEIGKRISSELQKNLKVEKYSSFTNKEDFANILTQDIQDISKDVHFFVEYHPENKNPTNQDINLQKNSQENLQMVKEKLSAVYAYTNGNIIQIERLPGNIGYIKLNEFPPIEFAGRKIVHAIQFLKDSEAIIFDVRFNGGGEAPFVKLIISYFVDFEPILLTTFENKNTGEIEQLYTVSYVEGDRFPNKPVYVLTSRRSASGAEDLAYTMKHLKRAIIVGEQTRGGANAPELFEINNEFKIDIPIYRPINNITKTNWEGVGVAPDIEVPQETALQTAHLDALNNISLNKYHPEVQRMIKFEREYVHHLYRNQSIPLEIGNQIKGDYGGAEITFENSCLFVIRKNLKSKLVSENFTTFYSNEETRIDFVQDQGKSTIIFTYRDFPQKLRLDKL